MFERVISLLGNDNFDKIKNTKILLVGVGGVGGFVFESLIRSGIHNITIIDNDTIDESNLNRQLVANLQTIGLKKVDVAKDKALNINKDINFKVLDIHLDESNINCLEADYDYIIDACDTLKTKVLLIKFALKNEIKIISAMGMGNRIDASKVAITKLNKTTCDPLAKKLRKLLREEEIEIKNINVVSSSELPIKKDGVYSIITPPSIAGILITNYIINDLVNL